MKSKTLLIAAAALAAGIATSQAQVYSQNIVGYINSPVIANQYALICNPLDNGTNTLNSLFPTATTGSQVLIWTGSGYSGSSKLPTGWTPNSTVAPGQGVFFRSTVNSTNTFVGSVAVLSGGSSTNLLQGNIYKLVGSSIPYADTLNSTNINLQAATGSQVLVWTGSGFSGSSKLPTGWSPNLSIQAGQGFFIRTSTTTNWVQTLPAN